MNRTEALHLFQNMQPKEHDACYALGQQLGKLKAKLLYVHLLNEAEEQGEIAFDPMTRLEVTLHETQLLETVNKALQERDTILANVLPKYIYSADYRLRVQSFLKDYFHNYTDSCFVHEIMQEAPPELWYLEAYDLAMIRPKAQTYLAQIMCPVDPESLHKVWPEGVVSMAEAKGRLAQKAAAVTP